MVVIVLATYNGETYLRAQLESICRQSYRDWTLLVRDDRSSDSSVAIVDEFCHRDPRIRLFEVGSKRLGPALNFGRLLQEADAIGARYVFFCDQDDVWQPDKLQIQLAAMRSLEAQHGSARPILVHCDMLEAGAELNTICPSFTRHKRYLDSNDPLATLITTNFITGCTILINKPLLRSGLPIPPVAIMHDHWFALCAAAAGRIAYVPRALLHYRRHARNYSRRAERWISWRKVMTGNYWSAERMAQFAKRIEQLRALHAQLSSQDLPDAGESLDRLNRYCAVFETRCHWTRRLWNAWRIGVPRMGVLRDLQFAIHTWLLGDRSVDQFVDCETHAADFATMDWQFAPPRAASLGVPAHGLPSLDSNVQVAAGSRSLQRMQS